MFQRIHIDVVRKPMPRPTSIALPTISQNKLTPKNYPIKLPPEILDTIAYNCSIPTIWNFAYSLCNMSIYHLHLRRRVRRSFISFFSDIDTFYQYIHECGGLLTGKLVWKLLHCGNWIEHTLELIVPYNSWLFVESYFLREGYQGDQANTQVIAQRHALQTLTYRKGDCIASIVLFEARRRMSPLQIISQHNFTSFMCYLSPHGFVIPFPKLTFASCAAVRHATFLQTKPPIDRALTNLQKVQCDPFTIGNKLIETHHLHPLHDVCVEISKNSVAWTVHWGPC